MKLTVDKSAFEKELALTAGIAERKLTIPILANVLLRAEGGELTMTSTDLEIGLTSKMAATVKSPGAITVPAKRLSDFVRLLPDGDIDIDVKGTAVVLKSGRSRTRLQGMAIESFPTLEEPGPVLTTMVLSSILELIARTENCISREESRFTLNGALFESGPDGTSMCATDGHRLSLARRTETSAAQFKALIPMSAMKALVRISNGIDGAMPIRISANDNNMFFALGDRILTSRKMTGNFPDYQRVLPTSLDQSAAFSRGELLATLQRVSRFSDERSRAVKFCFTSGSVKIHASVSDRGDSEEIIPIIYSGPDVEMGFCATYVMDFLGCTSSDEVGFKFKDPSSAGEFSIPGAEFRHVIMPMRI
jgi:DNA polymerase III subunit beta